MSTMTLARTSQQAFDIDSLLRDADVAAAPVWHGAPLEYHETYYSPAELDEAWSRWKFENGSFGCIPYSHMWHRASASSRDMALNDHRLIAFIADARCDGDWFGNPEHQHLPGEIPNKLMYQFICEPCHWHVVAGSENEAAEAWHDHALPGWSNLPAVPAALTAARDSKSGARRFQSWIEEHYPNEFQQPGYPIITERQRYGTRHVPRRSPWGGYDLSAPAQ